jgi:hypothetical protein
MTELLLIVENDIDRQCSRATICLGEPQISIPYFDVMTSSPQMLTMRTCN